MDFGPAFAPSDVEFTVEVATFCVHEEEGLFVEVGSSYGFGSGHEGVEVEEDEEGKDGEENKERNAAREGRVCVP